MGFRKTPNLPVFMISESLHKQRKSPKRVLDSSPLISLAILLFSFLLSTDLWAQRVTGEDLGYSTTQSGSFSILAIPGVILLLFFLLFTPTGRKAVFWYGLMLGSLIPIGYIFQNYGLANGIGWLIIWFFLGVYLVNRVIPSGDNTDADANSKKEPDKSTQAQQPQSKSEKCVPEVSPPGYPQGAPRNETPTEPNRSQWYEMSYGLTNKISGEHIDMHSLRKIHLDYQIIETGKIIKADDVDKVSFFKGRYYTSCPKCSGVCQTQTSDFSSRFPAEFDLPCNKCGCVTQFKTGRYPT